MRHAFGGRHLGRSSAERVALIRNMTSQFFKHGKIRTTEAKAKAMRPYVEKLITLAKHGLREGGNEVHARRLAAARLNDPEVTQRLFAEIAPKFTERNGGYTRILKLGHRLGDAAPVVQLELVEE